jgi:predicted outer membrane repeat protein
MVIRGDLTINGPGGGRITIDADAKSNILEINDGDDEKNRVVIIIGLSFINGIAFDGSEIDNKENLTVVLCQFVNGNATVGGAIENRRILTVDRCLFENNSADFGGAINNEDEALILSIMNSKFRNNQADFGGAIRNNSTIELITNSTFTKNKANVNDINFEGGGAINNLGTIKEISHSTFHRNISNTFGGAIANLKIGIIQTVSNSTFNGNSSILAGGAISNSGLINISFTTISGNHSDDIGGGIINSLFALGIFRIRNSIIAFNSPNNCTGIANIDDLLGNWSNRNCGFLGDYSEIILGTLADNGGPTETMALLGGDPIDGATNNCDALDEMSNPSGIPIGIDQRYFPRPFGVRCDSGAFETSPSDTVDGGNGGGCTLAPVKPPKIGPPFKL